MQGVLVIGEKIEGNLFINAVEFPDGSQRKTHFQEHEGKKRLGAYEVDSYLVYFDEGGDPVHLYKRPNGLWFLDI